MLFEAEMARNVSSQGGNRGPDGIHSDPGSRTSEPEGDEYSFYRSFVAAAAAEDPSLAAALAGLQAEEELQDDKQPAAAASAAAPVFPEAAAGAAAAAAQDPEPGAKSAGAQAAASRSFVKPDFTRAQIRSLRRLHGSIQTPAVKPAALMGEYQLLEQLGQGAHGTAHKAVHLPSGRLVCIKSVTSGQASSNQQQVQPLEPQLAQLELKKREVAVLAALEHPGIVRYLDSFVDDAKQQLFIVMEFLDGGDLLGLLQQRAKAGKPLAEEELLGLFVQVLLAMAHIHAMAILHRDLKCNNIFVSSAGLLKLGDFGLAKVLEGGGCSSSGSTAGALVVSQQSGPVAHSFVGTPNLLAPEMVSCGPYNQRADVWALGCVLFQMATGRPAFKANSVALIYRMIRRSEAPQLPSRYSPALRQLHASLMAKDPNLRPSTADILALHAELLRPHLERYTALLQQLGLQLPPLPRATTDLASAASSSNGGTALARSHMSSGAGGTGSSSEQPQERSSPSDSRSLHSSTAIAGTATAVAPWRQQLVSKAAAAAAQQAGHTHPKDRSTTLLARLRKRLAKAAIKHGHTSSTAPLPPPPQQQQQREVREAAEGDGLPDGGRPAQLVSQLLPPLRHTLSTVMSAGSGELEGASGGGTCSSQHQASSDGPSRLSNQAAAPTAPTAAAAAPVTGSYAARSRWSSMLAAAGLGVGGAVPADSLTPQQTSGPAAACTPPPTGAWLSAEACAAATPAASSLPQEALLHMQELAARYSVQQHQQLLLQTEASGLSTITERSEVSWLTQPSASFSSSIELSSSPLRSPCGQQWLTGAAAAAHLEAQDEQRDFGRGQQAATPPLQSPRFASPLQICSRSPELQPAAATANAMARDLAPAEPAAAGPEAAAAPLTQSEDVLVVITPTAECKGTMPAAATLMTEQLAMQERLQQLRLRLCRSASVSPAATWGSLE